MFEGERLLSMTERELGNYGMDLIRTKAIYNPYSHVFQTPLLEIRAPDSITMRFSVSIISTSSKRITSENFCEDGLP